METILSQDHVNPHSVFLCLIGLQNHPKLQKIEIQFVAEH